MASNVAQTRSRQSDGDDGVAGLAEADAFAAALRQNDDAFQKLLPKLLETDGGRCALLRAGTLVKTFATVAEAVGFAEASYPDGLYMLRKVMPQG